MVIYEKESLINQLAENLPVLRAKANLSQEEIAKVIGISRQTYCKIENGNSKLSWSGYLSLLLYFKSNNNTEELMEKLGIHVDEIMTYLDEHIRR